MDGRLPVLVRSAVRTSVTPAVSPTIISLVATTSVDATASMDTTATTTAAGRGNGRTVQGRREKHGYRRRRDDGKLAAGRQELAAIFVGFGRMVKFSHSTSQSSVNRANGQLKTASFALKSDSRIVLTQVHPAVA
jgi:hypothetical protein